MKRPRVLLGDDHTITLEGLRRILEPQFEIVGAVEDGRALVSAAVFDVEHVSVAGTLFGRSINLGSLAIISFGFQRGDATVREFHK